MQRSSHERRGALLAVAAAFLVLAAPLSATMLLPVSLEEITQTADVIVRGVVIASEGRLDESRGMVFTHVTLRVDEVVQGNVTEATVEIVVPGGVDGLSWTEVHGAPEVGPKDQDVVAFLYGERGELMSNVVYWQGLYHVDGDSVRETQEPVNAFLGRVRGMLRGVPSDAGGPDPASGSRKGVGR